MNLKIKNLLLASFALTAIGCVNEIEEIDNGEASPQLSESDFRVKTSKFYTPPSSFNNTVNLVSDYGANNSDTVNDSEALNNAIDDLSPEGGKIIIPSGNYHFGNVKMKSNIHIEVADGVTIFPIRGIRDGRPNRLFDFGGSGQRAVENTSITAASGRFTVDFTGQQNLDVYFARLGEVNNFKISDFDILDQRTEFASILVSFINKNNVDEPWPHNGIIENITQTDAHTGYGLIQGYAGDNILFRNLKCTGGVTLRLETDDQAMRTAGKGGLRDIFAKTIECESGITPIMFSPHFQENGKVRVDDVTATGCAYAVRVEHGFIEIFDNNNTFDVNIPEDGQKFRASINTILGGNGATSAVYRRNRGRTWAVRISNSFNQAAIDSSDPFIVNGLGGITPGVFATSNVTNVKVNYRSSGAKSKQSFLRYLPCSEWSDVCLPQGLGVSNGFEYNTPSLGVTYDITENNRKPGNYRINVRRTVVSGFPEGYLLNVAYDSEPICNNGVGTISNCN